MIKEQYKNISPSLAKRIISEKLDHEQRKMKPDILRKIQLSVDRYGWHPWFSRVVMSTDDTLIDGQHTLHYIANGDKDREVRVVLNVPRDMISVVGGDVATNWRQDERLTFLAKRRIDTGDISASMFIDQFIVGSPPEKDDVYKLKIVERYRDVLRHAMPRSRKAATGASLTKAPLIATFAIMKILAPHDTDAFYAELTGDSTPSVACKTIWSLLNDWHMGSIYNRLVKEQIFKVMKSIEIGCGMVEGVTIVRPDSGLPARWKEYLDRAILGETLE